MTYTYHILKDGPIGLWSFDEFPLVDSSGYGNDATYTGSPSTTRPIIAAGVAAQYVPSGDSISYPVSSIMIQGRETRAFSLEAWIKPQSATTKLLARDSSGLFIDDLTLRFSLEFDSLVSVEYNHLKSGDIYHVVAVYDGTSMLLYVNGEAVAGIEIPDETISSGLVDTTGELTSQSTASFVIDTPAVYNLALDYVRIKRHYLLGSKYTDAVNLSLNNGGTYYQFSDEFVEVLERYAFGESDSWESGVTDPTLSVVDNNLVNLYSEEFNEWQSGAWTFQYSIDAESGSGLSINGSRISWTSTVPVTVEYSEDAETWTVVENRGSIVGNKDLSEGYAISVRVTLPDTIEGQAVVENLNLTFYADKTVVGSDEDLPATFIDPLTVTLSRVAYEPTSFNDNAGVILPSGNGVMIPADTEFDPYRAIEMTVKLDSSTSNKTILSIGDATITSDNSGGWVTSGITSLYVDGVSVSSPYSIDTEQWHHVVAVFDEEMSDVYVGNNPAGSSAYPMRLGYLSLYSDTMTSDQVDAIYDTWVGMPAIRINDVSQINISEHAFPANGSPFRGYAFDWAITSAG